MDLNNLIPTDICMPTDMTKMSDENAAAQCTVFKTDATCVGECTWVPLSMISDYADTTKEMCRPESALATKLDKIKNCMSMTDSVICDANDDCKWGETEDTITVPNCLPVKFTGGDMSCYTKSEAECSTSAECFKVDTSMTPIEMFNKDWCKPSELTNE